MKLTRWLAKPFMLDRNARNEVWFEARFGDYTGLGRTPTEAIADARHEYRMFHDGTAEAGYCRMGRFHK